MAKSRAELRGELAEAKRRAQRLDEIARDLKASLRRGEASKPIELLIAAAYKPSPEYKPTRKWISIDGPNGAGKTSLRDYLGLAFERAGYTGYKIAKESSFAQLFHDARELTKGRVYESYQDREHAIGAVVTAGRLVEGRTNLLRMLQGPGLFISDRSVVTTIASQLGANRGVEEAISLVANSYVLPDIMIVLTADPETVRSRTATRSHRGASLEEERSMEDDEEISRKIGGYRAFINLFGGENSLYQLLHYDTTRMGLGELAKRVIDDAIAKYVPSREVIEAMKSYVTSSSTDLDLPPLSDQRNGDH